MRQAHEKKKKQQHRRIGWKVIHRTWRAHITCRTHNNDSQKFCNLKWRGVSSGYPSDNWEPLHSLVVFDITNLLNIELMCDELQSIYLCMIYAGIGFWLWICVWVRAELLSVSIIIPILHINIIYWENLNVNKQNGTRSWYSMISSAKNAVAAKEPVFPIFKSSNSLFRMKRRTII